MRWISRDAVQSPVALLASIQRNPKQRALMTLRKDHHWLASAHIVLSGERRVWRLYSFAPKHETLGAIGVPGAVGMVGEVVNSHAVEYTHVHFGVNVFLVIFLRLPLAVRKNTEKYLFS